MRSKNENGRQQRQAALDRAAGMRRGRKDLPDFRALRAEWDRDRPRTGRRKIAHGG